MDILKLKFLSLCFILENNTDGANQGAGSSMPAFHQMIAGELLCPLKQKWHLPTC